MTIEQELLNSTPLPLDIIQFCIEPFLIPDQDHWQRQFNLVVKSIEKYGTHILFLSTRDGEKKIGFISFRFADTDTGYKVDLVYRSSPTQMAKEALAMRGYVSVFKTQRFCPLIGLYWAIEDMVIIPPSQPPKSGLISRIKSWLKTCF